MVKELATADFDSHLSDSDTGAACLTEKVVDVCDRCPKLAGTGKHSILIYTRAQRGRIVRMLQTYPGEESIGMSIHFFVDTLENELHVHPRDDTFGSWADDLGLAKTELITLIREHAPPSSIA